MDAASEKSIFVSYKSHDVDFVRPFCERLMADGYSLWFHEYHVRHDQIDDFQRMVNAGIDRCAWGLLFVNSRYSQSPYCHVEVERLLRRLSESRIVVLALGGEEEFLRLYPELGRRTTRITSRAEGYRELVHAGVIRGMSEPVEPRVESAPVLWDLNEIAARFDPSVWRVDRDSLMRGSIWQDRLDITGCRREDYHTFSACIGGCQVKLWIDYRKVPERFEPEFRNRIRSDSSTQGIMTFEQDDTLDRKRLIAELKDFGADLDEVSRLIFRSKLVMESVDRAVVPSPGVFEEIGVHMFSTAERHGDVNNSYRHRLYSLRLASASAIFRIYKLMLPQPQLGTGVVVNFVFQFPDDKAGFFRTIPWADHVVRSFGWRTLETDPRLTEERITSKVREIRGTSHAP